MRWSVRGVLLRSSGLVQYGQRLEVGDRYREEGPLDRQSGVCSRRARRDDAITVVMHGNDATRTNEQTTEQPGEIRVTRYPRSVFSEQWVYIGKYGTYTDDLHSLVSPAGIPKPCSHRIARCYNIAISHDTRSHLSKVTSLLRGEIWSDFRGKGKKIGVS